MIKPENWHKRFSIQAEWTKSVQDYLVTSVSNYANIKAIEIGCGTGAVLKKMEQHFSQLYGLDINYNFLNFAKQHFPAQQLICGNGYHIPFIENSFGVVICHYLLLWIAKPNKLLEELYRILENNGSLLILAEPDYGGRIDYPPALEEIGKAQIKSLQAQGADPLIGRKLPKLLQEAGFREIEFGILGNEWKSNFHRNNWESEWDMFNYDLQNFYTSDELSNLKQIDLEAYIKRERVLYVPTFFAVSKK